MINRNLNIRVRDKNNNLIKKTPYYSYLKGRLPKGCEYCVKGKKLVLFITGICPRNCWYCPLSKDKKNKDKIFANEKEILINNNTLNNTILNNNELKKVIKDIIEEAKISQAKGAGITGGDPLSRIERTTYFIRALKKEFGKKFHIHLYTSLDLLNKNILKSLYDAGLDEIRLHPDIEDDALWKKIFLVKDFNWDYGLEIPVIPGLEDNTKNLLRLIEGKNFFVNLNELEISELTINNFKKRNLLLKNKNSYAIKGSLEFAMDLMKEFNINFHFCTGKLKDKIQMGNRIKLRSIKAKKPFDYVTNEGLLVRGAIYVNYFPKENYQLLLRNLSKKDKENELIILKKIYNYLLDIGMPSDAGFLDEERLRILLNKDVLLSLDSLKKEFPFIKRAIVTEYPTADFFLISLEPLDNN